jgi:hypothetical protein
MKRTHFELCEFETAAKVETRIGKGCAATYMQLLPPPRKVMVFP